MTTFGENLRARRTELGLTQAELAALIGMTRSSIANTEGGRQFLPLSAAAAIAKHLHTTVGALLGEADGPPPLSMLTDDEHRAIALLAEFANLFAAIVGDDRTREGDIAEAVDKVHQLQQTVMAQAAARAYPDRYRLFGGVIT